MHDISNKFTVSHPDIYYFSNASGCTSILHGNVWLRTYDISLPTTFPIDVTWGCMGLVLRWGRASRWVRIFLVAPEWVLAESLAQQDPLAELLV